MKIIFFLLMYLIASTGFAANKDDKSQAITIALNDWASQIVLSYVVGNILSKQGYQVLYRHISVAQQWGALRLGQIDLQIEVWEGSMAKDFKRMIENGAIVDAGIHDAKTREEWWYPEYVADYCPGLPDWRVLNKCVHLFTMEHSGNKGVYISGPWDRQEGKRIRALKLNFLLKRIGGEAIKPTILLAIKKKTPLLVFNWTPNWVENRIKGSFVEFPVYEPECITNPKWGPNPMKTMDCGNPVNGWLKKAVSTNVQNIWPCAYKFIRNINFNNEMISEAAALYEYDRLSYNNAAVRWQVKYKDIWIVWFPKECYGS
ncbi:ABC transporter substrate-binding protein [Spartinivicinus poritis]|uniref:ABC transporter substrate-binding protein n=1 Tax=Spartinivicinus poritis TaxID=2994640 RepID=A0ABT5U5Q7_9GAMM|nr:ABC transporter substrate-binding protein [Spartinivicinus sp. A2-2]MDE1461642.1 ABC transporter substrate-binding protein [Spartinivicinus sp. A2-2]